MQDHVQVETNRECKFYNKNNKNVPIDTLPELRVVPSNVIVVQHVHTGTENVVPTSPQSRKMKWQDYNTKKITKA